MGNVCLHSKQVLNPDWFNSVGWLKESTQARLEFYNPLVMSKMFLLHDALILDKFDSQKLFWLDAGITKVIGSFGKDLSIWFQVVYGFGTNLPFEGN
mgnify:CR=1 FL=1